MIKSYTLDCGCYFEHKPQPGADAYQLVSACSDHNSLSSTPPLHTLPPAPFSNMLTRHQAPNDPMDDWRTGTNMAVQNQRSHTVCEPTMPSGARMSVQAGMGLPLGELEDTQPIPVPAVPHTWPHVLERIVKLEGDVAALMARLPPFPHEG